MTKNICLVAVDIRSLLNIGSLFRTCDGFGADLVLVGISPTPIRKNDNRLPHVARQAQMKLKKTALGAEKSINWRYYEDSVIALGQLKQDGYTVCAIEQTDTSIDIAHLPKHEKLALVVGTEVSGLDQSVLNECDQSYEIKMLGQKESFNVSVAAAIALYVAQN